MDKSILRDNIICWTLLSDCLNSGVIIPDALAAVSAECSNRDFLRETLDQLMSEPPVEIDSDRLAVSTQACIEVAMLTTMWGDYLGTAGDLLLRRAFVHDPVLLAEYYYVRLLEAGFTPERVSKFLRAELNSDYAGQKVRDLETLRALTSPLLSWRRRRFFFTPHFLRISQPDIL